MVSAPGDDDFSSFLEFGLNFSAFDTDAQHGPSFPQNGGSVMVTNDTQMDTINALDDTRHANPHTYTAASQPTNIPGMNAHPKSEVMMDRAMQAQTLQHPQQQHQLHHQMMQHHNYHGQHVIPPTPNSVEMHKGAARYYQQMDMQGQAIYDRYHGNSDDQVRLHALFQGWPILTTADGVYATRFARRHSHRCPIPTTRIYDSWRILQSPDVPRARSSQCARC